MGADAWSPGGIWSTVLQTPRAGQVTPHPHQLVSTPSFPLVCSKDKTVLPTPPLQCSGEDSEKLYATKPEPVVLIFEAGLHVV